MSLEPQTVSEAQNAAPLTGQALDEEIGRRAAELAKQCEIELDVEEDPVAASDVKRAAADDVALRAGIAHAPKVLPKALADYLTRSWQLSIEAFGRAEMLSELEIAAGWARRHADAARSLLAITADLPRDWRAVHIPPGTPFWDEPSETQPPGWFVFGGFTDDPEEGAAFVLNVEQALDRDETGMSLERVAKAVADRLNEGLAS